jgi:hypothetical protein
MKRSIMVIMGVLCLASVSFAAPIVSFWNGNGDGVHWSDPKNWEPLLAVPPVNKGIVQFYVTIPDGKTVEFDIVGSSEISSLVLGTTATRLETCILKFNADCHLTILSKADIYGKIDSTKGNLTANTNAAFPGNSSTIWGKNTAKILICAPNYSSTDIWRSWTTSGYGDTAETWSPVLMLSSGAETVLNLSSIQTIDAGYSSAGNDHTYQQIKAETGGSINLSGVTKVIAPKSGRDRLDIGIAGADSQILLNQLQEITGDYHGYYYGYGTTQFNLAGGQPLNLDNLATMDEVDFYLSAGAVVTAPKISSMADTTFHLSGKSSLSSGSTVSNYSSTDIWRSWTTSGYGDTAETWSPVLMLSSGAETVLNLSSIQTFDAGFSSGGNDYNNQQVIAEIGGAINLSGVKKIILPVSGRDGLAFSASSQSSIDLGGIEKIESTGAGNITISGTGGSMVDLGSLKSIQTSGSVSMVTDGGSTLRVGGFTSNKPFTIQLKNAADRLFVTDSIALGSTIGLSNQNWAHISFAGNLSQRQNKNLNSVILGTTYAHFVGTQVQQVEVVAFDVSTMAEMLPAPVPAFGQMIIGGCNNPSFVHLVDEVDNGFRGGFGGNAEALYLMGKFSPDLTTVEDGLKVKAGSVLYMGGIHAYAMIGGVMTDLLTLFGPGQTMVAFDEGFICLGSPEVDGAENLILNGGFESGNVPPDNSTLYLGIGSTDVEGWTVGQNPAYWMKETYITDAGKGLRFVELRGNATIQRPVHLQKGHAYQVWFDLGINPNVGTGTLAAKSIEVSIAGQKAQYVYDPAGKVGAKPVQGQPWPITWITRTMSLTADTDDTQIRFAGLDDPAATYGILLDNVRVIDIGAANQPNTDFDKNGKYDLSDFALFSTQWMSICGWGDCDCLAYDLNHDGKIEIEDLLIFVQYWMTGTNAFSLDVSVSPTGGGQVIKPGEGQHKYPPNTVVDIEAAANDHYHFLYWGGSCVDAGKVANSDQPSTTVTMDGNCTLTAYFAKDTYKLKITSGPEGTVTDPPGVGERTYEYGTSVELHAQPTLDNYVFDRWTGTIESTSPDLSLVMDTDYTLHANFKLRKVTLTIGSCDFGNVVVPGEGTFEVDYGSIVNLKADPDDYYRFVSWTGAAVDVGKVANPSAAETTVLADADYTLNACFEENPMQVIISKPLDSDPKWTVQGQWAFGVPAGQGGSSFGLPDPTGGATGTTVYGVNLNGDYSVVVGGPYYLIAGPFDLTGYTNIELEFMSWLNSDYYEYVSQTVGYSVTGSGYTQLWKNPSNAEVVSNAWSPMAFVLPPLPENRKSVYFLWGYQIKKDRAYPYAGWNIDDIQIRGKAK